MRTIPAAIGLAAAISVGALFSDWSQQANSEGCSLQAANLEAPSRAPAMDLPSAEFQQYLRDHPGLCQPELSTNQKADIALSSAMIGFAVYIFCLLFGKFHRWASR